MKYLPLFLILSNFAFGQLDTTKHWSQSFDFIYGQKYLSHKTFDGALNNLDKLNFGKPLTYVGIGTTLYLTVTRGVFNHPSNIYYAQVVPQDVKLNDSITAKITGFNLGFTIHGFDAFPHKRNLDLIFNMGINTGRLRFYGNSLVTQKNPYFSPKVSMSPRVIIGRIGLQAIITYEFDISRKNWRKMTFSDSPKINLPQTSSTGLTILASIGYVLKERPRTNSTINESDWE